MAGQGGVHVGDVTAGRQGTALGRQRNLILFRGFFRLLQGGCGRFVCHQTGQQVLFGRCGGQFFFGGQPQFGVNVRFCGRLLVLHLRLGGGLRLQVQSFQVQLGGGLFTRRFGRQISFGLDHGRVFAEVQQHILFRRFFGLGSFRTGEDVGAGLGGLQFQAEIFVIQPFGGEGVDLVDLEQEVRAVPEKP